MLTKTKYERAVRAYSKWVADGHKNYLPITAAGGVFQDVNKGLHLKYPHDIASWSEEQIANVGEAIIYNQQYADEVDERERYENGSVSKTMYDSLRGMTNTYVTGSVGVGITMSMCEIEPSTPFVTGCEISAPYGIGCPAEVSAISNTLWKVGCAPRFIVTLNSNGVIMLPNGVASEFMSQLDMGDTWILVEPGMWQQFKELYPC